MTAKLSELIPDQHNANKGTKRGAAQLETSLRKYGAGRSILVDRNGRIIAGNKTVENAAAIGLDDVVIVETDGTKLVAVKRVDLDLTDDSTCARELAYADNRVAEVGLESNLLLPTFKNIKSIVMSDDCTVFVTAPQGGELGMMMMMKEAGLPVRHVLIWKKNAPTFSMGRLDYDYQHEPILLTWGKRHKRPMLGKHKTSVWEIDKPRKSAEHPTMKPVELIENAALNNSDRNDIVFDSFSGSGTTIIACENLNRKCRAIEIDPGYVAVAIERWAQHTGKTPELIG